MLSQDPVRDRFVPPEEDLHKGDFVSPRNGSILIVYLLDTPLVVLVSPCLQEEEERVEGSRQLHGSPRYPSSPWRWTTGVDHKEEEDPTTFLASFSLAPQSCI